MLEIKPRVLCILDMTQSPSCTPRTSLISFFTPNGNFSGKVSAHWGLQRHFHCFELTTLEKQTSISTLSVLTGFCRSFLSLHWERPLCWTSPTVLTFSSVKEKQNTQRQRWSSKKKNHLEMSHRVSVEKALRPGSGSQGCGFCWES